jgi:hypothetical protein
LTDRHSYAGDSFSGAKDTVNVFSLLQKADYVCFVVTDLEGSTAASNGGAAGYRQLQVE